MGDFIIDRDDNGPDFAFSAMDGARLRFLGPAGPEEP